MGSDLLQSVEFWNSRADIVRRLGQSVRHVEATPVRVRQRNCEIRSVRLELLDNTEQHVVTKGIRLRRERFLDDFHFERTKRAYEVEIEFYKNFSSALIDSDAKIATYYDSLAQGPDLLLVLEDLSQQCDITSQMHSERECQHAVLNERDATKALKWLAAFHANFLGKATKTDGIWDRGSYWSLEKRRRELDVMTQEWKSTCEKFQPYYPDLFGRENVKNLAVDLAAVANELHIALEPRPHLRTLLHGDFKTANLFFLDDGIAVCDFQWTGPGLGIVDAVYLLYSSVQHSVVSTKEQSLLYHYYKTLLQCAKEKGVPLEEQYSWTELQRHARIAYLDFVRFCIGSFWGTVKPEVETGTRSGINLGIHRRSPEYFVMMVEKAATLLNAYRSQAVIP